MTEVFGRPLGYSINFAPQHHYVAQGALRSLEEWVRSSRPPSGSSPIALVKATEPIAVRDSHGLARGGVRTPWMNVPIARLTGVGAGAPIIAEFGAGEPFIAAKLAELYPGGEDEYLRRFGRELLRAVQEGFIVPDDEQEIISLAAVAYRRAPSGNTTYIRPKAAFGFCSQPRGPGLRVARRIARACVEVGPRQLDTSFSPPSPLFRMAKLIGRSRETVCPTRRQT